MRKDSHAAAARLAALIRAIHLGPVPFRRRLRASLSVALLGAMMSCASAGGGELVTDVHRKGRLLARPQASTQDAGVVQSGARPLGLSSGRDALLRVPKGYDPGRPAPLVVMLHGAGGDPRGALELLDGGGFEAALVLAPASRGWTWDIVLDEEVGPDVAFLDRALAHVFERYAIDPARVAIAGFSDGASYALTLAVANGSLFRRTLAFSPGFVAPPSAEGRTRIWMSHGKRDRVLPIDRCSRQLAPRLRSVGFDVSYREFDGGHSIPPSILGEAWEWFAAP